MKKPIKKIIIILIIIILIAVGASFFSGETPNQNQNQLQSLGTGQTGAPLTQNAGMSATMANTEEINREFVSMLLNLEAINLNDDIFSEPAFSALVDNTVRLNQPGNEGRPNPFAPIGTDGMYDSLNLGASVGDLSLDLEAEENTTPTTEGEGETLDLENVDSSDDLTDEELDEALSSLGSS